MTTLSSKLVASQKYFFAKIVVDAVMQLDELLPLNMIGIKKVQGGAMEEYQNVVDAEWEILYRKLQKIVESGAKVVLSKLPIEMLQLNILLIACGGAVLSTCYDISDSVLGTCEVFEEKQIGGERFNFFTGCPNTKTVTLILRGGAEQFIEECERSLHDAIMIVRRALKNDLVVAGGGAIEMELSKFLRDYSRTVKGKEQLIIGTMAKALEIIPRQLCDNAGFDSTNILNMLRQKHATGGIWYGVDIHNEDIADNYEACVWEPAVVKINALTAATEASCLIVSLDETIKNPKSNVTPPGIPGRGRGRPF
ncbi:t-complex protein 1 subunit eta [Caerostris extrusa]|uniref:T-complex protein 1 subunit eta n=1 Tax=Caerostris extrusa TaxID=172846 RepID=A0AAV4T4H2_CAEEX|nr:t-complex protein 1 subunit eta [Caerostris extrusa]